MTLLILTDYALGTDLVHARPGSSSGVRAEAGCTMSPPPSAQHESRAGSLLCPTEPIPQVPLGSRCSN